MAPGSPPPVLPQRRHDLDVAKQQLVCIVTIIATLFVLCPERYQLYRNLAVIPVIAYVTSRTFDLIISLNEKWDRAPAVVKYFVPVQIPEIAPPTEQICCLVKNQIATSGDKVHQFSLHLRSMVRALVDWTLRQTGGSSNKNSPGSEGKQHKQTKQDRWVAVLVTTPVHEERNPFQIDADIDSEILELISWESSELSPNLAIILSSTFKVQLTLCLIPKSIWFSRKTLLEKFTTGLFWSHQPGQPHCQGQQWDEDKIRTISRVQYIGKYIGKVDEHKDIVKVNERFDSLRNGWNDVNTYWSDVDYAILFAFLLVGKSSTDVCKKMFDHFTNLRVEYAQRNTDLNRSRAGAALLTLLTGGLAAPVTIPMMMGANDAMSANDRYLWGERMNFCKGLLERYKELAAIIELKDIEINVSKPVALPPALETSWLADDAW